MDLDQKEETGTTGADVTSQARQKSKRISKKERKAARKSPGKASARNSDLTRSPSDRKRPRKRRKKTPSVNLGDVQKSPSLTSAGSGPNAPKQSADLDKETAVSAETPSGLPTQLVDTPVETESKQEQQFPAKYSNACSVMLSSTAVSSAPSGPTSYCRSSVSFDNSAYTPMLSCVITNAFQPEEHSGSRGGIHTDSGIEQPVTTTAFRPTRQAAPPDDADSSHGQLAALHETAPNFGAKTEDISANVPPDSKETKATSLYKTGGATSMSYRRMTYRGSVRMMRPGRDAEFLLIAVAIDVLFVLLLIVVGLDFALVGRGEKTGKRNETYDFCCKREATELSRFIDTTVNPCDDLHAYVCRKTTRKESEATELLAGYENSIFNGTTFIQHSAGDLLANYYRSCRDAMKAGNLTQLASDAANSILDTGVVKARMTSHSIVSSFFSTALISGGVFIVNVRINHRSSPLSIYIELAKPEFVPSCKHCAGIMHVINKEMKASITTQELQNFARDAVVDKNCSNTTGDGQLLDSLFNRVTSDDIREILSTSLFINTSGIRVTVRCFDEIKRLVSKLAPPSNQPLSTAFLLADASARLTKRFEAIASSRNANRIRFCKEQVRILRNLWNAYLAECVTSVDKDILIVNLFDSVKTAVLKSFTGKMVFNDNDDERHDAFDIVQEMHVVLPRDALPTGIRISTPALSFTGLYYTAHRYELLADRYRAMQDLPEAVTNLGTSPQRRGLRLFVQPGYYLSLQRVSKWFLLIHFPKLGAALATLVWHFVIFEHEWSSNSRAAIRRFADCFSNRYMNKPFLDKADEMVAAAALGLDSMQQARKEEDMSCYAVEATEGLNLSHAQFFYLNWAFGKCAQDSSAGTDDAVNLPSTYAGDYRRVFACPLGSYMAYGNWCPM